MYAISKSDHHNFRQKTREIISGLNGCAAQLEQESENLDLLFKAYRMRILEIKNLAQEYHISRNELRKKLRDHVMSGQKRQKQKVI